MSGTAVLSTFLQSFLKLIHGGLLTEELNPGKSKVVHVDFGSDDRHGKNEVERK